MAVPQEALSHHTVWIGRPGARPHPVRSAAANGRLYCFGDDGLADISDGTQVAASVHRIANGPPLSHFDAIVRTVAPDDVDREALLDLAAHVPLGRNLAEVEDALAHWRQERRIVELVA